MSRQSVPKQLRKKLLDHSLLPATAPADAVVEAVVKRQRQDKQSYFTVAHMTLFPEDIPTKAVDYAKNERLMLHVNRQLHAGEACVDVSI